jgi:uncharacterized damage-inducible protein DinB
MSVGIGLDQLLTYSDYERRKWQKWFAVDASRLEIPFQVGGRFPTIGSLVDHVFLIERRHLSRLEGATPPDATGIAPGDVNGLFDYGDLVRAELHRFVAELTDARASETFTFTIQPGPFTVTRRKLTTHILLHEVRHWAQIAFAARVAGHQPPGEHDIFFCPEIP